LYGAILIISILAGSERLFNGSTFFVSASEPSKIRIYVGPTSVLADNSVYDSIFVQLQDSRGTPVRAQQDTAIRLSASLTNIGTVDPIIMIPKDSTYATARFYSTYTPGSTIITAAASGYMTVQASMTTVGPVPSVLAVYAFPPILPADGGSYPAIIVQLQDSIGSPAKAPIGDVQVTLSSSNTTVGTVDPSIIIGGGTTYTVATFNTKAVGSATITAIASGYSSKQAVVTTQEMGGQPVKLKVYVGPPRVPADGFTYNQVAVQLQDSTGKIAQTEEDVNVILSSSATAVGTIDSTITIPTGSAYASAQFHSTYRSGTTTIAAAATNYMPGQEILTTVGPVPSKLAVYCVPSSLPADNQAYNALIVQLQDSGGTPAKDPVGNISVYLFSSNPDAGDVGPTLIIPFGKTHSTGTFLTTFTSNTATITAQASGYDPGQAQVSTYLIDQFTLSVSLMAQPATVNSSMRTNLTAFVTYNGVSPCTDATLNFTSDRGGNFSTTINEGNGYYNSVFTTPATNKQMACTVQVNASKTGYTSGIASVGVTVTTAIHTGNMLLHILDGGKAVSEAEVVSTSQPKGISSLSGLTDDAGLVVFNNIREGTYTMQIAKSGYEARNETITVTAGETADQTIDLSRNSSLLPPLPILIAIIAVVAVAVALVIIVLRRYEISFSTGKDKKLDTEQQNKPSPNLLI
jgi:uncharacterized membrane protein